MLKRLLVLTLFFVSALSAQNPLPVINYKGNGAYVPKLVQSAHQISSGSVASINIGFGTSTQPGNTLVVSFCNGNANKAAAPITDTQANTWAQVGLYATSSTNFECAIFYAVNTPSAADTITVTPGGTAASIAMQIYEVAGLLSVSVAQPGMFSTNSTTSAVTASPVVSIGTRTANVYGFVAFGLGTAAQTITVCNGYGTATCPDGSNLTSDSGQLTPTTPAGLFSMVGASQFLDVGQQWNPAANAGVAEPWAVAAASFSPAEDSHENVNWLMVQPHYSISKNFAASSTTDNAILSADSTNPNVIFWVDRIKVSCTQTTAGIITLNIIKRSAADTVGTAAAFTVIPDDSRYPIPTPVINTYTGTGPTVGTVVGNIDTYFLGCMAPGTASPDDVYILNRTNHPIPLRYIGTAAEGIAINVGNAALTGGNLNVTYEFYALPNGITP